MGGFYQGKGGKGGAAAAAAAPAAPAAEGGDGLPGGLKRKLQALGYPELGSVSLSGQAYMKEKIRLYEKIDRAPLRKFDKSWYEADEANQLQNAVPQGSQGTQAAKQRLGELLPSLNSILQIFSLPQLPQDAQDVGRVSFVVWAFGCLKCVLVRVSPTSADEPTLDLQKLPLGVDVADPEVRKAVAVLRLLHGLELQQLQVNINTVINELQQLTANPQTDSRLGRVGR
eukprot:g18512.t1